MGIVPASALKTVFSLQSVRTTVYIWPTIAQTSPLNLLWRRIPFHSIKSVFRLVCQWHFVPLHNLQGQWFGDRSIFPYNTGKFALEKKEAASVFLSADFLRKKESLRNMSHAHSPEVGGNQTERRPPFWPAYHGILWKHLWFCLHIQIWRYLEAGLNSEWSKLQAAYSEPDLTSGLLLPCSMKHENPIILMGTSSKNETPYVAIMLCFSISAVFVLHFISFT